jgi:hypothetical protein
MGDGKQIVLTPEQINALIAQAKVQHERFLLDAKARIQDLLNIINTAIDAAKPK